MKKRRYLFVTHEYSGVNGSTLSLYNLIDGIQKNSDIECVVLCPRRGPATSFLQNKSIKTITWIFFTCIKSKENNPWLLDIFRYCVNQVISFILFTYLKFSNYDLVISNSATVDVGANASRWSKQEHLYYIREFIEEDINCEFINEKQFKKNIEYSDYVVYISKAIEDKYESKFNTKKTLTIHDGIIVDEYYVYNHILFQDERVNIIQVGAVTEGKGAWNTLNAARMLVENGYTDFKLDFIGKANPEMKKRIDEFIEEHHLADNVELKGYCDNVENIMANSDILIMNSELEGLGRVTVEGMLAGCLVVGRATGGTLELIDNGKTGFLFEDNSSLVELIQEIIQSKDKSKYIRIAQSGQKNMSEKFDHMIMSQKLLKFINK